MRKLFTLALPLLFVVACTDAPTQPLTLEPAAYSLLDDQGTGEISENRSFSPASTNELNEAKQVPTREGQDAPHVVWEAIEVGEITLMFVNHTNSLAFFEYRIDGVTVGSTPHPVVNTGFAHPTTGLVAEYDDVIHPGVSVDGRGIPDPVVVSRTFAANQTVEIRLALGGERDWDFDWTLFHVPATAYVRDLCRNGGWRDLGFENQGLCIQWANTGKDSRAPTPDADGDVTWTSGPGVAGLHTVFYVFVAGNSGKVTHNHPEGGELIMTVDCVLVEGNEAWFAGQVTEASGAYDGNLGERRLFWVEDNGVAGDPEADRIGSWNQKDCADLGVWRGTGTVTDGNLTVRSGG
jgi:hypothetical protein